jgi:hypothetical protein
MSTDCGLREMQHFIYIYYKRNTYHNMVVALDKKYIAE